MQLIFAPDESETNRATGYATVPYSSDAENETIIETVEGDVVAIFEDAKASGKTLDGADESIDAAIDDPLTFRDYLVLEDGSIAFDEGYA